MTEPIVRVTDLVTVFFCLVGMSLFFVGQFDTEAFTGNLAALLSGLFFGLYFIFLRHPRSLANRNTALSVFYGNVLIVILMIPLVAPNFKQCMPPDIHPLIESGILLAAITAVILNAFFNGASGSSEDAATAAKASEGGH